MNKARLPSGGEKEGAASRAEPAGAPLRSFAALRHPGFRGYLLTSAAAMMADNIEHVISYWVMFEKFHSPALAGFAVLSHWLPFLLFAVYFGALADRYDSRRIIQLAQFLFMAVSIAWALLFLTDTIQMWHAAVLLIVHGMAGVLWSPASQLLLHDIVGREHIVSAVRLNATSRQLGILLGPAVGGGLMLLLGPAMGLLANALIYLPLVLWLWKAPYGAARRQSSAPARATGLADTLAVLREASGNRTIFSMILLAGAASLLVGNAFQAQMPEYAHDLGTEKADFSYAVLLAANAAGALTAGLSLEAKGGLLEPSPRTAIVLVILWCISIAGFAVATSYPIAVALMFVSGFLFLAYGAMIQALIQLEAPPQLRGRLIGLYYLSNNGLRAFSGITVGVVGALIGIHWSLALSALVLLAVTIALLAFSMRARER
ncbi:MAG TPA: MFS transporter [Burkholderiales bacterium]|nr:MFS transporter [Burkholderiales bacterium]